MILLKNDYIMWDANHASSNTIHGSINKQMCIREFFRVTRKKPSEGALLQQFICNHYRVLTELSCCTRDTFSLKEQRRFEVFLRYEDNHGVRWKVNTDWNKIEGPLRYRREPIT